MVAQHILRCKKCGTYTMKNTCPACGGEAVDPKPPKYSPEDRYGKYRRLAKKELMRNE